MVITYHGGGMVKLVSGERVVLFNPSAEAVRAGRVPRSAVDVVLVSCLDPRWDGAASFRESEKKILVVDGPGEYETDQVFIWGLSSVGPERSNTIYTVAFDGLRLVHLGALTEAALGDEGLGELGAVDVLFLPISAATLEPSAAAGLARRLDPRLVVPTEHQGEGDQNLLKLFKEFGMESPRHESKLVLRAKDLVADKTDLVILTAS